MQQSSYTPTAPLAQYVSTIWLAKAPQLQLQSDHHAPLFTELIFNYGDQFEVSGQHVENISGSSDHKIISGLKTSPFHTAVSGLYQSVGLILKPYCYGYLLNKFDTDIMSQLSEVFFEHLLLAQNPDFTAVEKHLLHLFKELQYDNELVKFEQFITDKALQKGALSDFNHTISLTQKSFIQKFKKHYMLSPNQYIRLKQINYSIQLLSHYPPASLTAIGLNAGFYDQSHFIRVFKQYCGMTPNQFRKELKNKG